MPETAVPSSSPAYRIRQGETVILQVFSSVLMTLRGIFRIVYDDGSDDQISVNEFDAAATRTGEQVPIRFQARANGYIVGGIVFLMTRSTVQPARGQTYVRAFTVGGPTQDLPIQLLLEGYLYQGFGVNVGHFVEPGPRGGEGSMRSVDLGDPAAGSDYDDVTVPAGALWKIRGFHGVLVTAAGGTDRTPTIRIQDGSNVVVGGTRANNIQDPSETATYLGANNNYGHQYDQSVTGVVYNFVMPDFPIPEGFDVTFVTAFLDGSDNWGDGQLFVEEWLVL